MLKAEQIQSLSKSNQSVDGQKTKERIREVWNPTDKKTRDEILKLCGLTQFAVQKSASTGTISAKTVCAISQTLKINPYYLIGESDEKDYFTDDIISDFLRNRNITFTKKSVKVKTVKTEKVVKPAQAAQTKTVAGNKGKTVKDIKNVKGVTEKPAVVSSTTALSAIAVSKAKTQTATPSAPVSKTTTQTESSGSYETDALDVLGNLASKLFASLSNANKDKIEKMTEDELSVLLSGMVTRAKINGDSNNLLKLVKYILSC